MKISPQTKSFIFLISIAILGTYACIIVWGKLIYQRVGYQNPYDYGTYKVAPSTPYVTKDLSNIDTAKWKTYENKDYKFSFKYAPTWKVLEAKQKDGFTLIEVDPGPKYFNFKIYISPKSFYVMDGIPTKSETIGGYPALNAANELYGIKTESNYFTFDVGWSVTLDSEFNAMVRSVQFTK